MEAFEIKNLSFTYAGADEPALTSVELNLHRGELMVLCGPSGCGKSTLLRLMKPSAAPQGRRTGTVYFSGESLEKLDYRRQSRMIGFVQQSPENQIVTDKVWHELAFGAESLGLSSEVIRRRTAEMASFFGIQEWYHRDTASLSGGQKQLLSLASVMVMQPEVLILDEPTSRLDPIAASELLSAVVKLNRELGTTVIITEHRLEELLPSADRAAVMERGRIICCGTPAEVGAVLRGSGSGTYFAMPTAMRVWAAADGTGECPVTVRDGRRWLESFSASHELRGLPEDAPTVTVSENVITARELRFRYERGAEDVVRGLSLSLRRGEIFALLGGNGTGKTTSLRLIAGLETPQSGKINIRGKTAMLPQEPQALFTKKTVREELDTLCADDIARAARLISLCRLTGLEARHPYDLSGGEQQRLALAMLLCGEPDILLLDEPTKGLDAEFKRIFAKILRSFTDNGGAVLTVSHDIEFCADFADRCALFFDGAIAAEGRPREFFAGNSFYTSSANRMARGIAPEVVTAGELAYVCGAELAEPELDFEPNPPAKPDEEREQKPEPKSVKRSPPRRRTLLLCLAALICVPLTLAAGLTLLENRKYYFTSLLVLLECMTPFFLSFEGRRPQARELTVTAVLCALGVAGRAMFYMLPQFKPVIALTVIAGAGLGGETGFLVGAVTMLVSNMLFSQGPWTPWQMFAMGLVGLLSGIIFGGRRPARAVITLFGAVCAVAVYGAIMNFASALLSSDTLTLGIILSCFAAGFPLDCVQAAATALFLWFAAPPMLKSLERMRVKYGLLR